MMRCAALGLVVLALSLPVAQALPPMEVASGDGWFSSCHALTVVVPARFVVEVAKGPAASTVVVEGVPAPDSLCPQVWASSFVADGFDPSGGLCVANALGESLCLEPAGPGAGGPSHALAWTSLQGHAWGTVVFTAD